MRKRKQVRTDTTKNDLIVQHKWNAADAVTSFWIAGTLLLAGVGKLDADGMRKIIAAKDRAAAGATAPPEGLYLNKVVYSE